MSKEETYKAAFRLRVARIIASRIADTCFIKPSYAQQESWERIVVEELIADNERH